MFVVTFTNGKAIRVICRNNGQAIAFTLEKENVMKVSLVALFSLVSSFASADWVDNFRAMQTAPKKFVQACGKAHPNSVTAKAECVRLKLLASAYVAPAASSVSKQARSLCQARWTTNGVTDFYMMKFCIDRQEKAAKELGY